ncbi:unnamed protein product [Ascophyllum nodosum]
MTRLRARSKCSSSSSRILSRHRMRGCYVSNSRGYVWARRSTTFFFVMFAAAVSSTANGDTIAPYYASNCYEVGGGNMGPPYLTCVGCQYVEAFECLDTMRSNDTANVPSGCRMDVLTVEPDSNCCPVFTDPSIHTSLDMSTSAYPDAIRCLENAGCGGDKLHTALIAECLFNHCNEDYSCVATYSRTSRAYYPALRSMAGAWAVARILMHTLV